MSTPPPPPSPYAPPESSGSIAGSSRSSDRRLPWEERDRLGIVEAFVQTVRLLVTDPTDAFSRLRPDGDLTSPMLFGIIVSWLSVLLSQVWNVLFMSSLGGLVRGLEGLERFGAPSVVDLLVTLLVWPIIYVVMVFVGSAILHLCLLIVSATEKSEAGFEGTLKVYAYSTVAWLAAVIPFVGSLVLILWSLVLEVIGFTAVHRTSQGRALVAVLIPTIVCCLCGILGIAVFSAALFGFVQELGGKLP